VSEFVNEIVELNEDKVKELLDKKIESEEPQKIMKEVREAMGKIGDKYENKEYFLPDLMMSGEILKDIMNKLGPKLKKTQEAEVQGKVLLGTVAGDIHDIGKDVVKFMLEANGIDVKDLGVDVPAQKFVEAIKEYEPDVVALSGFLTLAFDSMKNAVEEIKNAGLRDKVKIMIGGGTVDESLVEYTGADAFGESAVDAVKMSKKWIRGEA
jgi:5-methyltetrahydrofolate--homocysteine methyltransferase